MSNTDTTNRSPRAIKIVGILMLCGFSFTAGRFVDVWGTHVTQTAKMKQILADSAQFEAANDDLLETIRSDLQKLLDDSGEIIQEAYRDQIESGLNSDTYWHNDRRPFKDQFESAIHLTHLSSMASNYYGATFPSPEITYDLSKVNELTEGDDADAGQVEAAEVDESEAGMNGAAEENRLTTEQRLKKLYTGQGFNLQNLFPSLVDKMRAPTEFTAMPVFNQRRNSGESTSFEAAWFLRSHSTVHLEGAFLLIRAENDLQQNNIRLNFLFQEFSLGQ